MPARRPRRTTPLTALACAAAAVALTAQPAVALAAGGPSRGAAPAAGSDVAAVFPHDGLTVTDPRQRTGRRLALPAYSCTSVPSCGLVARLNELDGFDLDPRLAVRFTRPVDPAAVAASMRIEQLSGPDRQVVGVDRVVYDAGTRTLYAHPAAQLEPGTTYRMRLPGRALPRGEGSFTTLSATDGLRDLRAQVDRRAAGGLSVDAVVPAQGTTVQYLADTGTATLVPSAVPSAVTAGSLVFGSYQAPSWLRRDSTIAQTPTRDGGPAPVGVARLPFVLVLPPGQAPAGGWPVAVFGHGFTGSAGNVLLAGATNAAAGIATISTDVVGHGFGPRSAWRLTTDGQVREVPAYGRGVDVDGQPGISSTDGSSTSPSGPAQAVGSRDALRQTAADLMTLVRAVGSTTDAVDLRGTGVTYFGQSFGGIYGTMLAGVEPRVVRAGLNVPGGPITEIVRSSPDFRPLLTQVLGTVGLLNGGSFGFTESQPLRGDTRVTRPVRGALGIQDYLARMTWLERSGSPEAFAPLLAPGRVLFQIARGDKTVTNPTSYTLLTAGDLIGRASLYRNDLTPLARANPHAFLLLLGTPFGTAAGQGQRQITTFLGTGETIDPDGAGPVWEVPAGDPGLLRTTGF